MSEPKIVFFDTKPYDKEFFNLMNKKFNFHIKYLPVRLNPDTAELTKGYDAVCAFVNDDLSKNTAKILINNNIKIIAMRCAGYNNVDFKSFYKKIHVTRVPAYSPYAVAEHAVALMLSLNRKTHRAYYRTRDNNFAINGLIGFDMYNKSAGIIGTGKIGKICAQILRGMQVNVYAFDHHPDHKWAKENNVIYVDDIDSLYKKTDIISLHCPLTPQNVHMIGKQSIEKMKKGVMIINTGRGALIDTKELINGLKNGQIGSAGLDVYEEEDKYFFEDYSNKIVTDENLARLLSFPNVLVTSHQGFFTKEALTNIAQTTLNNIHTFFTENKVPNEICYQCNSNDCIKKKQGKCF